MSTVRRSASLQLHNNGGPTKRSPRRLRTKTPSVNELSKKSKVSPKGKRKLEFQNQREKNKPLKGKRFYLDLNGYRKTASLRENIKELGGTVEEFLSKDVTFVVTNSKEVDQKRSPRSQSTPSPGVFNASPFLSNKSADSPQNTEQQQTVKKHTRGQAFVNQSLSQTVTHKYGSGNVLSNARTWGVTIVRIEKILEGLSKYIKPGKSTPSKTLSASSQKMSLIVKVRKLNTPFIKVEDQSRQFKPLVHELKEWPKIYFGAPPGWCPFDPPPKKETDAEKAEKLKVPKKQVKDCAKFRENNPEPKKQKRGYCECCCIRYEDLDLHLKSEQHKSFARDSSNYSSLDQLIARGNSLEDFLAEVQEKNAKTETPESNEQNNSPTRDDVLPVFRTPVNSEPTCNSDEKVKGTPTTRSKLRTGASASGSPCNIDDKPDTRSQLITRASASGSPCNRHDKPDTRSQLITRASASGSPCNRDDKPDTRSQLITRASASGSPCNGDDKPGTRSQLITRASASGIPCNRDDNPDTRLQLRTGSSASGSPCNRDDKPDTKHMESNSISGKLKGCGQEQQKMNPEERETMEIPARRTRSSHIPSPLSKQRDRSQKSLESNDSYTSPTTNASKCGKDCKISEHSKQAKTNPSSKSYIKPKPLESDEGNSKENCDPSPNQKQAKKLQSQSQNKIKTCKDVEPNAEGSCSNAEESESKLKPTDGLRVGTEIKVCGTLDRQPLKEVTGGKDSGDDHDNDEDDDVFESPGQVRHLRNIAKQQTLGKKSSFKMTNNKKSHKKASHSKDRDSTKSMEAQEKLTETYDSLESSLLPKVSKHKAGVNGSNQSLRRSNKNILPSVSTDKDQKLSKSRTSTARKQNRSREMQTSDETESIEMTTSDCPSHSSKQQDKDGISSTSTVTLPREDNSSPAPDDSESPVPRDDDEEDYRRYSVRKRSAAGDRERNTKSKSSAILKQSRRIKSVINKNKKSVSVSDQPLQVKQKPPQKPKKTRSRSCPEQITPKKEKVGGTSRSGQSGETKSSELTSSPRSGYSSPVISRQHIESARRKLVEKKETATKSDKETSLDSDTSMVAHNGSDPVRTAGNRATRHLRGDSGGTRQNNNNNIRRLQTLFDSEDAKTKDKFHEFDDSEDENSTKKVLVRNAKKNRIDTVARKQGNDSSHSLSFASPPPQQVPSFELSEFDENMETEQESFSVCINSLVDSIHVDDNNAAPNTFCESGVKSKGKGHLPLKSSFLQELVLGKQNAELSSGISEDNDGDYESVVCDSTGEESDDEVIEPIVTPIRQHKRKSVESSDDEIEYKFPPKRRRTLNSTSSITESTDEPYFPVDKNVEKVQSSKAMESFNSTRDTEPPTNDTRYTKAAANEAEEKALKLSESVANCQQSFTSNGPDADYFDFSEWDEPFHVTIQERVKLRVRKTLRNVEKTVTEKTENTKTKSTFSSQEPMKAGKTRSTSMVESTPKSETRVAKSKRHRSLEADLESNVKALPRSSEHGKAQRPRLASTPVRPLRCTLTRLDEAQLRELTTSPRTLSPISSPTQSPLTSTARCFRSSEVSSEKKGRHRLRITRRSTRSHRRISGNVKTRNSSQ